MLNVYNDDNEVIGRVNYSTNLDFYDGNDFSCGNTGCHKGLTKLINGNFVLINISDLEGTHDYAEIISIEQALQEILKSNNLQLLYEDRFSNLNKLYKDLLNSDFSEDN